MDTITHFIFMALFMLHAEQVLLYDSMYYIN